jgi:hypothetical protein
LDAARATCPHPPSFGVLLIWVSLVDNSFAWAALALSTASPSGPPCSAAGCSSSAGRVISRTGKIKPFVVTGALLLTDAADLPDGLPGFMGGGDAP